MEELRSISGEYEPHDLYNVDYSALFYRMGPRCSCLAASENRATSRALYFINHKQRVTVVLSCCRVVLTVLIFYHCRALETQKTPRVFVMNAIDNKLTHGWTEMDLRERAWRVDWDRS